MKIEAVNDDRCFCCGKKNSLGLRLSFSYPEPGKAETRLIIPGHFSGWRNYTHGGLLAMLLDETMAHACVSGGDLAITAEMTVRYRNPVTTGQAIRVMSQVAEKRSRIVKVKGSVTREDGLVVAEGEGRFLKAQK